MKTGVSLLSAFLAFAAAPALAQNTQFVEGPKAVSAISTNEVIAILQAAQLSARMIEDAADGTKTIEAAAGEDVVYIAMRACAGSGAASPCQLIQPYGFFNGQGVTFDQINNFNMNVGAIATAALLTDGRGIMASKIYLVGGVTKDNVTFELGSYFLDIARLLQSVKPGLVAQISYKPEALTAATAGFEPPPFPAGETPHVNFVGEAHGALATDAIRKLVSQARR